MRLSSPLRSDGTCCTENVRTGEDYVCIYVTRRYTNHRIYVVAVRKENYLILSKLSEHVKNKCITVISSLVNNVH